MHKIELEPINNDNLSSNIKKLKSIFPEIFIDEKIDFDKLKHALGNYIETDNEKYSFTWCGKNSALKTAYTHTNSTLIPCIEASKDWDSTQNIYIKGDNLEVLKLLLKTYKNKVKMIYIDPPYNTGNDFVYNDDFKESLNKYKKSTGNFHIENSDFESEGRYHTKWLNMIYPRLVLAKKFLSKNGVIFISIDDNEIRNLKFICDEIFGENNFITQFAYEKTQHFGRQKLNTYSNVEYVLCYAKELYHKGKMKELLVERINTELQDAPLYNSSNNISTILFPSGKVKFNISDGIYTKTTSPDYELITPVEVKNGKNNNDFSLRFRSRWAQDTVLESSKKGTTFWVKTESFAIRAIYGENKSSNVAPKQIIFTNPKNEKCTHSRFNERVTANENATKALEQLIGDKIFSYPKPVSLIKYLISLMYDEKSKKHCDDFIVLDFFSGSGTTAQACMELNMKDNGKRKYILVQIPEKINSKLQTKNKYENICDIGIHRIQQSASKILLETGNKKLDLGCKVYELK